jgi:hypothetical protein
MENRDQENFISEDDDKLFDENEEGFELQGDDVPESDQLPSDENTDFQASEDEDENTLTGKDAEKFLEEVKLHEKIPAKKSPEPDFEKLGKLVKEYVTCL